MSLTRDLRDPASPLSRFLCEQAPDLSALREDVRAARDVAPVIRPPESLGRFARAVGTAFDWRLRYYVSSAPGPALALSVSAPSDRAAFLTALDDAVRRTRPVGRRLNWFEEDLLNRACLSLALTDEDGPDGATTSTEAFRTRDWRRCQRDLLGASEPWLVDLRALSWAAYETLGERLSLPSVVGPTFAGSPSAGGAQGDLILGDCLIEVKTSLATGAERAWIEQLLGYLLLDYPDRYHIRSIGLYLARQATLICWPLDRVFRAPLRDGLAHLATLRRQLQERLARPPFLGGGVQLPLPLG